jgi:hypothetical protein
MFKLRMNFSFGILWDVELSNSEILRLHRIQLDKRDGDK